MTLSRVTERPTDEYHGLLITEFLSSRRLEDNIKIDLKTYGVRV